MATKTKTGSGRNLGAELAYLTRTLKAPSLAAAVDRLAERARAESWTHEEFLVACLQREVAARESHGGEARIRTARFPARKALEEFDFDHQRSLQRDTIAHLGTLDFVAAKENVVFLGPPGTGKTHLSIGLGIRACQAGHRVAFATAAEWVARLAVAHHAGRLQDEITKLGRTPLLIIDLCRGWNYADPRPMVGLRPCGGGLRALVDDPRLGIVTGLPGTPATGRRARRAPSPGSGTGLEHGEVAYRITVMLGLFLEHHLEAAAHDVLPVWIWVRRLATTHPIELGLGEAVDDTPHRGHASEPRREYLVECRGGFEGEPELRRCVGRHPAVWKAQRVVRRILLEHGITKPGIAGHQQVP